MGMYGYEYMLKLSQTNPKYKQSTKELYRIRIIHTTISSIKEVWSKRLVRLVQDTFRIGSDLNVLSQYTSISLPFQTVFNGGWSIVLEGVPGYTGTRESYVRFAGRSPLCWTPNGLPRP